MQHLRTHRRGWRAQWPSDTLYTQNDYNVWCANFSRTAGSGSVATARPASSAVPEPTTVLLLVGVDSIVAAHRRVY